MKLSLILSVGLIASLSARADFSYTATTKTTGGAMMGAYAAAAGAAGKSTAGAADHTTRHFIKGDMMKLDSGDSATIFDFGAQTLTHLNHTSKTYTVSSFSDIAAKAGQSGAEMKIDVQDTGQRKTINGHDARLVVFTMEMESQQMRRKGSDMKMRMTDDLWISSDVPGAQELHAFYQRIAGRGLFSAMLSGRAASDPGMAKSLADLQRKIAGLNGVPVLQVMKMGAAGAQVEQEMSKARAQLEELQRKGGPQAKMAAAMLAKMGGSGALFEMTIESSNFSTSAVPASEFAIPAGYQKKER